MSLLDGGRVGEIPWSGLFSKLPELHRALPRPLQVGIFRDIRDAGSPFLVAEF